MWVRLQLDFGWRDFASGMFRLILPHDRQALANRVSERWGKQAMPVLSVRSGLDLLLGTLKWPAGSEIVYSALNIPDMTMVARQHGIVPMPADLDMEKLAPDLDLLESAITAQTRAILIAHLYGNFVPMAPIIELARKYDLMVIEDCAENYDGVYTGHPEADVSLFSFGPLKTATALAGGVLRARDPELFVRLQSQHAQWPVQSRLDYFNRICKYSTMKFFGARWIYPQTRRAARLLVGDVDQMIQHTAKSFREDEILMRLRQQPCGPLLAWMARRLANFDHDRLVQRTANGKLLADLLRGQIVCPGADVEPHNYWLFPVMVTDVAQALQSLHDAGFDATRVNSMRAVEAPEDRADLDPARLKDALDHMILLPCYPGIPETELRRMANVLIQSEQQASLVSAMKVTLQPAETTYNGNSSAPMPEMGMSGRINAESVGRL